MLAPGGFLSSSHHSTAPQSIPELKARLAAIESQISSLQHQTVHSQSSAFSNENLSPNLAVPMDPNCSAGELKGLLMHLRQEHAAILQNIDRALRLVDQQQQQQTQTQSSPSTPSRLIDRINAAIGNTPTKQSSPQSSSSSPLPPHKPVRSSPLAFKMTPALEKSHITFDILRGLETDSHSSARPPEAPSEAELSVASRQYLQKYGLI